MYQCIESEKGLVAALVKNPENFFDIAKYKISESDFLDETSRQIFTLISNLRIKGESYTRHTVASKIASITKKEEEEILKRFRGYPDYHAITYAKTVKEASRIRAIEMMAKDLQDRIKSGEVSSKSLSEEIKKNVDNIDSYTSEIKVHNTNQISKACIELLSKDHGQNMDVGFSGLDEKTNGVQPSSLNVIAARPGMGKTTFAIALASQISLKKRVLYISYELGLHQMSSKIIGARVNVDTRKFLKASKMNDSELKRAGQGAVWVQQNMKITCICSRVDLSEIRHVICKMSMEEEGLGAVFIDNINNVPWPSKTKNLYEAMTVVSGNLKEYAQEFNVPIFALAQLNRESVKGSETPKLHHLRDSGSIEQDADLVMLLHRDDYDASSESPCGEIEVIIAKNRFAATGKCKLDIDLQTGRVEDKQYAKRSREIF